MTTFRVPDQIIQRHLDGTVCPSYSWPHQGRCDLIGTGIHADMMDLHAAMSQEDVRALLYGPIDVPHLIENNEIRRTPPTHDYIVKVTVVAEISPNRHTHGRGHSYCYECDKESQSD